MPFLANAPREDAESSAVFWFPRATMSDRKAVIKNADMSEDMQQDAVECATQALEKYNIEKDIAAYIKKVQKPKTHCLRIQHLLCTQVVSHGATLPCCLVNKICFCVKRTFAVIRVHPVV